MTEHDVLVGFRLRLFTLAEELGNVSAACRAMGVHRSTYYRLKRRVDRWGLEALRVRERRRPRMPNQIGPHLEQRIVAFALAHPGLGPRRISAELAREKWGGIRISEHGVWRVLRQGRAQHPFQAAGAGRPPPRPLRAQTRPSRQRSCTSTPPSPARRSSSTASMSAGCRAPRAPSGNTRRSTSPPPTPGPSCDTSERNPRARHTRELLHRVARELKAAGWKLEEVTTDNGSEFRAKHFRDAVERTRRPPTLHQGRPAQLQRLRRAPPAHHPRGMLAARLRPLARPQDHRAPTRPRRIPPRPTTSTAPTPDA